MGIVARANKAVCNDEAGKIPLINKMMINWQRSKRLKDLPSETIGRNDNITG